MSASEHANNTSLDEVQLDFLEKFQRMHKQLSEVQCKFLSEIFILMFKEAASKDSDGSGFRMAELALSQATSLVNSILSRAEILSDIKVASDGFISSFSEEIRRAYSDIFRVPDFKPFMEVVHRNRTKYQNELLADGSYFRSFIEFVPEYQSTEQQADGTSQLISENSLVIKKDKFGFYHNNPIKLRVVESPLLRKDQLAALGDFHYFCRSFDSTDKYFSLSNVSDNYFRVYRKNKRDNLALVSKVSEKKDFLGNAQEKIDQILDCLVVDDRSTVGDSLVLLVSHKQTKDFVLLRTNKLETFLLGKADKVWLSQRMIDGLNSPRLTTNNLLAKSDSHFFFLTKNRRDHKDLVELKAELITQKSVARVSQEGQTSSSKEIFRIEDLATTEAMVNYKLDVQKNSEGLTSVVVALLSSNKPASNSYKLTLTYFEDYFGRETYLKVEEPALSLDEQDAHLHMKVAIAQGEVMVLVGSSLFYLNKRGKDPANAKIEKVNNAYRVFDLWSAVGRFVVRRSSPEDPSREVFSSYLCHLKPTPPNCEELLEFSLNSQWHLFDSLDFSGSVGQSSSSDFSSLLILFGKPKHSDGRTMDDRQAFSVFSLLIDPETLI